jgi:DNA-binding HxlR family transcriptional regulator
MNTAENPADKQHQLAQALKIFGDAWTLAIVWVLATAAHRFNDLQRALGNISPTTLTDRLKKLEGYGLIEAQKQTVDQLSVIYVLTEKGKKMLPVLGAIESFSKKFL